jgi:selenide, water dikinase
MKASPSPVIKDLVLLGAGHAHVAVLRKFGMEPMPGVRLSLVTREVDTPYSGMLPGLITGTYSFDEAHIDTGPLARFAGARLIQAEAIGLDPEAKHILLNGRPPVPYDVLSIDIGSTPGGQGVPGVTEFAIPVKPIDRFLSRFEKARERILAKKGKARVAVVGGGAAGVELAFALDARLKREIAAMGADPAGFVVTIISGNRTILPALPEGARKRVRRHLTARGIVVLTGARVEALDGRQITLSDGRAEPVDEVFWTTESQAAPWLRDTGLALDAKGFISIDSTLRSLSHRDVFAAGDIASLQGHELPKSGVYAVRQGPVLADNIRQHLDGRPLKTFRPQGDALYLISTGDGHAIGTRNGFSLEGRWVWRWKDRIDRAFMNKFNHLPEMAKPVPLAASDAGVDPSRDDIADDRVRCGGCGAKIGAGILSRALGALSPARRDDVILGLDAFDDAAVVDIGGSQLSVQTVDYFPAMIDDPYLFGRIAANHALGDIYAMGAGPQVATAIVTIPHGPDSKIETMLSDLMIGANEVLKDAGCALVGGHTTEGTELALGFAINGLVHREQLMRKEAIRPGDVLILTKPIGTGTVLAADMRGKAKARWVMAAIASMGMSHHRAARALVAHGAHAMTDITGFGLIGHLANLLRTSGSGATLDIAAIPVFDGARETVAAGFLSSLYPQNVQLGHTIRNLDAVSKHRDFPLLFDPQTSGGLLAAVPAKKVAGCIAALKKEGYPEAAVIGYVTEPGRSTEPIMIDI